jgi:hypothetical protein
MKKFVITIVILIMSTMLVSVSVKAQDECVHGDSSCIGEEPGADCGDGGVCEVSGSCQYGNCSCICTEDSDDTDATTSDASGSFISEDLKIPNPTKFDSLEDIIEGAGTLIQPLFIIVFAFMVLYSAWMRLSSKGDSDKLETSQKMLIASIAGFAIAVLAPTIVTVVSDLLGTSLNFNGL